MNLSRVRASKTLALALAAALSTVVPAPAGAQERAPVLWFQGTRLVLERAVPDAGDFAVSTGDAGLRRFLDRLGATVSYQPQQRYAVVTAQDRRTIVFTVGDPTYTVAGVRAQAPFAPQAEGGDVVLPFFTLARALYVEPVPSSGETVLQPRIGALDVRADGGRTVVTVRGAMPLIVNAAPDAPERVQIAFPGLGSSLAPSRRAPGTAVDAIAVAVGGTARVPVTTITIDGLRGATHRVVPSGSPDAYTVVFEAHPGAAPSAAARPNVGLILPPPPAPGGSSPPAPVSPAPQGGTGVYPLPPGDAGQPAAGPTAAPPLVAGRASVTDLSIDPASNDGLAVRVTLSGAVGFEWHRLTDNRWYIDFRNATLTGPGRDERPTFGAVQSVRVRQIGTSDAPAVRVAFTTGAQQQVDLTPTDSGLTITVQTTPATDLARIGVGRTGGAPLVASAASPDPFAFPTAVPRNAGNGSKLIVIDPGHGGADVGAVHNGITEKLVTFDVAQRLRTLLVAQGWNVRLTRDTDIDPVTAENIARARADGRSDDAAYLQTRCDVANNAGARLFISIHVNSAPVSGAHGTTFYWYKPQDAAFAQALERSVIPAAGTADDGTRHENFYVVRHTTMPAVLIETAFSTNPGDVALLRQPSFLQSMAQGIAAGVRAYAGSPSMSVTSQQ